MIKLLVRLVLIFISVIVIFSTARAADDYKLGAGDVIKITVFDYPELSTEVRVSESGTIMFPMLGQIVVGGLSFDEASNLIAARLDREGFIRHASVSVLVSQFNSQQVSVIGQVNKPGKYPLDKASTFVDLLAMAEGIDETGGDKAIIIRPGKDGQIESRTEIDLYAFFQGNAPKHINVQNGDTIFIPRADVFYIYGEVQHPGMLKLERNMTVLHAISAAGGLTPKGTENGVKLKRQDEHGEMQTFDVESGDRVKPNDILYVRESWF